MKSKFIETQSGLSSLTMTEDLYQPCAYVKGFTFVNNLIENAKLANHLGR